MFKLVNQSTCRRFGVVMADKGSGLMESGEQLLLGGFGQGPSSLPLVVRRGRRRAGQAGD